MLKIDMSKWKDLTPIEKLESRVEFLEAMLDIVGQMLDEITPGFRAEVLKREAKLFDESFGKK